MSRWQNVPDPSDTSLLAVGQGTFSRLLVNSNTIATGSGSLRLTYMTALRTETITKIRLNTGGTGAAATPTLVRAGLYTVAANGDLALVGSIPNTTSALAVAGTEYEITLSAPVTVRAGSRYAIGILVVTGATAPTMLGNGLTTGNLDARAPRLCALLSGQTDLPASITDASLTISSNKAYSVLVP